MVSGHAYFRKCEKIPVYFFRRPKACRVFYSRVTRLRATTGMCEQTLTQPASGSRVQISEKMPALKQVIVRRVNQQAFNACEISAGCAIEPLQGFNVMGLQTLRVPVMIIRHDGEVAAASLSVLLVTFPAARTLTMCWMVRRGHSC